MTGTPSCGQIDTLQKQSSVDLYYSNVEPSAQPRWDNLVSSVKRATRASAIMVLMVIIIMVIIAIIIIIIIIIVIVVVVAIGTELMTTVLPIPATEFLTFPPVG